ncbi:MAG TPA: ankyrin repeat domain-containing protein [Thermoplasmata archaeon]|nr:ankyrin repeat domain-containing protein [Thermoplasmata archaeon]
MADEDDLLSAVQKNDAARVRAILDRNPLILRARTPNGTLVLTAAYYGAGDALKLLLERTPEDALNAYEAATTGNARRLKTILGQSRKRINDANEEGFTPLGLAAFFGHVDAVKVLLEAGADVNLKPPSRFQNTAVDAAVAGDHTDVVRVLLAAGADPNVRSEASYTTLHKAAVHGNLDIVRMLVDRGADVKATRDGGHTPLEDAREKGHEAIVEFLEAREGTA